MDFEFDGGRGGHILCSVNIVIPLYPYVKVNQLMQQNPEN
jgi:hypothetical protein